MTLTVQTMLDAMKLIERVPAMPRVVFTPNALKDGTDRLFPESKHRSRRIRKKLLKRHGGEFRKVPCVWRVNDVIYAHPAYRQMFEAQFPLRDSPLSRPHRVSQELTPPGKPE